MAQSNRKAERPLPPDHYFVRSQQPLHALVFMLPLIVVYELGVIYLPPANTLAARTWIQGFLQMFGAVGEYLPGLAIIAVLLSWHVARRDPWRLDPPLYAGMWFESVALALPLLLLGLLAVARPVGAMIPLAMGGDGGWKAELVSSIGAGVYEELVFRLVTIALIHLLLVDVLRVPAGRGAALAIVGSALFFAVSHFNAHNPFNWSAFVFYVVAGLYFAVIYVLRGFGIVAATHALYDVFVILIKYGFWPAR
jgi:hypothetical protein